ncbi:MAG TPA: hypothetical protein VI911_00940 [Patescibacteria group bacterium]|nr:hypothetical protein [Patescibacteria group bacterium]
MNSESVVNLVQTQQVVAFWLEKVLGTNWKTITGGFLIIGSVVIDLMGSHTAAKAVMDAGLGLGVVGIGHKLQRL